jgi:hypothetical protein
VKPIEKLLIVVPSSWKVIVGDEPDQLLLHWALICIEYRFRSINTKIILIVMK